jgi:hypothetical protein
VIRYDSKDLGQQPLRGVPWSRRAPQYGLPLRSKRRDSLSRGSIQTHTTKTDGVLPCRAEGHVSVWHADRWPACSCVRRKRQLLGGPVAPHPALHAKRGVATINSSPDPVWRNVGSACLFANPTNADRARHGTAPRGGQRCVRAPDRVVALVTR